MPRAWAIVPAAGSGRRMGSAIAKQYLPLLGRPMLAWTLDPLLACERIEAIVLVVSAGDTAWPALARGHQRLWSAQGGIERCHSVQNGLARLTAHAAPEDWVLVHDAARPCLASEELAALFAALADHPVGGLLAVPVADTLKEADAQGRVLRTVPRQGLWRAMTPQMFRYGVLRAALAAAVDAGLTVTDEAAAMEHAGHRPVLVPGRASNLKVTGPEDLALAEALLRRREDERCA